MLLLYSSSLLEANKVLSLPQLFIELQTQICSWSRSFFKVTMCTFECFDAKVVTIKGLTIFVNWSMQITPLTAKVIIFCISLVSRCMCTQQIVCVLHCGELARYLRCTHCLAGKMKANTLCSSSNVGWTCGDIVARTLAGNTYWEWRQSWEDYSVMFVKQFFVFNFYNRSSWFTHQMLCEN